MSSDYLESTGTTNMNCSILGVRVYDANADGNGWPRTDMISEEREGGEVFVNIVEWALVHLELNSLVHQQV